MLKLTPFWTDDFPRPADLPASGLPERADVAVIGGGYTGLHAALALRRAGASVAVLEQQTIGWGASSRNGGMATSGLKAEITALAKQHGPEQARAFWAWAQGAIDHLERTVAAEGIACDFARSGHVTLAAKPAHLEHMRAEAAWMARELGHRAAHVVGPDELGQETRARGFHGGLVDATSAALHPAKYVFGLARAAAGAGAALVEGAEVQGIARAPAGGFMLATAQGALAAGAVLLATNGYTTGLVPGARRGIFPGGSYVITTERLSPTLQAELSPRGRMFFDSRHFLNYFRLTPDGRMLFGGRHDLSTAVALERSARDLRARMIEVFPQLAHIPLSHTWTGKLGLTFDLMPHIGQVAGIWYAYGYAGHGVAVAGAMGRDAAALIAGQRPDSPFVGLEHRRWFFTPYEKYYLPLVSAWFRFRDLVS